MILKPLDTGALSALLKKGVLEQFHREELNKGGGEDSQALPGIPKELNPEQSRALESIREQFEKHQTVLLHGVTSSGKTELYIHLIREKLDRESRCSTSFPKLP